MSACWSDKLMPLRRHNAINIACFVFKFHEKYSREEENEEEREGEEEGRIH